jgi:hypothetical protein
MALHHPVREATEAGVHILATRNTTSLTVKRGERSHVITP